ncbi:MAG: LapA family protein [Sphingobium sp.]|nr:LapA family protein [Sphingobium sp.]
MIAVKRLQSLFWVLLVAFGALGAYLVSLRVATERNELMQVRAEIARARGDIRYLETELAARSSIRQLERWNADDFRYSPRASGQYLDGERSLASLNGVEANGPVYVAPPVMVAMMDDDAAPQGDSDVVASPAALQIRSDASVIRVASAAALKQDVTRTNLASIVPDKAKNQASSTSAKPKSSGDIKKAETRKSDKSAARFAPARLAQAETPQAGRNANAVARRAERMAMLDARLLDDRTLGDLGKKAAAEKRKGAN